MDAAVERQMRKRQDHMRDGSAALQQFDAYRGLVHAERLVQEVTVKGLRAHMERTLRQYPVGRRLAHVYRYNHFAAKCLCYTFHREDDTKYVEQAQQGFDA